MLKPELRVGLGVSPEQHHARGLVDVAARHPQLDRHSEVPCELGPLGGVAPRNPPPQPPDEAHALALVPRPEDRARTLRALARFVTECVGEGDEIAGELREGVGERDEWTRDLVEWRRDLVEWTRDLVEWTRDLVEWTRDLVEWTRDLIEWTRDLIEWTRDLIEWTRVLDERAHSRIQ